MQKNHLQEPCLLKALTLTSSRPISVLSYDKQQQNVQRKQVKTQRATEKQLMTWCVGG